MLLAGCTERRRPPPAPAPSAAPATTATTPAEALTTPTARPTPPPQPVPAALATPVSDPPEKPEPMKPSRAAKSVAHAKESHHARNAKDHAAPIATKLSVKRLILARGVNGREPVGIGSSFAKHDGDRVYAFVEVTNEEKVAGELTVTFSPASGKGSRSVQLNVGAAERWRTWAFARNIKDVGPWTATVRNAKGEVLARSNFQVTP